ncbi:TPA_asm: putative cell-to-cell movement protein [birds-foot trefoil-associated virus]|uniref:Cell-to-cell movement protein n=1 Tax=birds-foot trefoil-associated virus TaxID=3121202 RepID=A0A9Y0T7J4_9RHAB|nr:TPA_asm: putative cell-to-cell movement protein [Bird's-foot trefoil nucleorhabdovirus]
MGSKRGSKTPQGAINEPPSVTSKFQTYNFVEIRGERGNVRVEKKNMLFATQVTLFFQRILWGTAAELKIKNIICVWHPLVEPGTVASVNLKLAYELGEETDDLTAEETVVSAVGRISEAIRIEVFPTQPVLKTADMAFYVPWSAEAEVSDTTSNGNGGVLGLLKIWCNVSIKGYRSTDRTNNKIYQPPIIDWSNLHYPFYIPFYMMKKVRGIHSTLWRDTEQYRRFKSQVLKHADEKMYDEQKHLGIMQILSKDDVTEIGKIAVNCHSHQGGYCTCGDMVNRFLASALLNNHNRCKDHGTLFDSVARDIMTGNIKLVNGHPKINF